MGADWTRAYRFHGGSVLIGSDDLSMSDGMEIRMVAPNGCSIPWWGPPQSTGFR